MQIYNWGSKIEIDLLRSKEVPFRPVSQIKVTVYHFKNKKALQEISKKSF